MLVVISKNLSSVKMKISYPNILKQHLSLLLCLSLLTSCQKEKPLTDQDLAVKWGEMTLFITKNTPGNSPTYASRCLGYIGLTMYESVVKGFPNYTSFAGQLDSLDSLPMPQAGQTYNWQLSLNAAEAFILKNIYNQTSDQNKGKIDSLETAIYTFYADSITDKALIDRSIAYGKSVASTIFEWSKTDGGHRAYLKNFDKKMVHPTRLGCWSPPLYGQSFSHYPLHPHWGQNRTFLKQDHKIEAPSVIPFDTLPNSAYYKGFIAVYNQEKILTQDQKEAAIWWSDDPDETFTPPGHSYYLATTVLKQTRPSLMKCAETYAKVGMAVADAFINCWQWKYQFFTERPNNFINKYVDERWESFWPDPPFPAFPSGHAIQAAATATVLTDLYGDKMSFTDNAHVGRKRDELREVEFKARHFNSFWEVAEETANSRFYGGIHTPQDNTAGLEKGKTIGTNINQLTTIKR